MGDESKKSIFIVEDEKDIREELVFILEKEGFEIKDFSCSDELLKFEELVGLNDVDLLIADIMMPGLHGDEMVKELAVEGKLVYTPVLFLSALGEDSDIHKAHSAANGALSVDYLRKPFQTGWLIARVKNLLKLREFRLALSNAYREIQESNMILNKLFNEEMIKSEGLKQTNDYLNRENSTFQQLLKTAKDVIRKIVINDLPLVKFVASILEKNERFIEETVIGGDEGGDLFKVLNKSTEPLKTVAADIEQVVQVLLSIGFLNKESLIANDLKKTSFYEIIYNIYQRGGFSSESFAEFLGFAVLKLETGGDVELF